MPLGERGGGGLVPLEDRVEYLKHWSLPEFQCLTQPGIELWQGQILCRPPGGPTHGRAVAQLTRLLLQLFGPAYEVRVQLPFHPGDDSQVEPDFCLRPRRDLGGAALVVEVSDSSLSYDRLKAQLYAAGGLPEYWILNLQESTLEVYRHPCREEPGYRLTRYFSRDEAVEPLALPGQSLLVERLF